MGVYLVFTTSEAKNTSGERYGLCVRGMDLVYLLDVFNLKNMFKVLHEPLKAVIFVVDSANLENLTLGREALHSLLASESLCNIPVLVFANKKDLPGALGQDGIIARLGLRGLSWNRWHVQVCFDCSLIELRI